MIPLTLKDTFTFSCHAGVPCFNQCCRDLNQLLTPYDILRLKNDLGMSSGGFLSEYTIEYMGPETGFPVIAFKTLRQTEYRCPFVTDAGCRVYTARPGSCRTYPLIRLASRSRETGAVNEQYMLLKEEHCRGFQHGDLRTVGEWITAQELGLYNEMNDMMLQLISAKNRRMPGPLSEQQKHLLHMALYDLDRFRTYVHEKGIGPFGSHGRPTDDVSLLTFAFGWVEGILFGPEPAKR